MFEFHVVWRSVWKSWVCNFFYYMKSNEIQPKSAIVIDPLRGESIWFLRGCNNNDASVPSRINYFILWFSLIIVLNCANNRCFKNAFFSFAAITILECIFSSSKSSASSFYLCAIFLRCHFFYQLFNFILSCIEVRNFFIKFLYITYKGKEFSINA